MSSVIESLAVWHRVGVGLQPSSTVGRAAVNRKAPAPTSVWSLIWNQQSHVHFSLMTGSRVSQPTSDPGLQREAVTRDAVKQRSRISSTRLDHLTSSR